MPKNKKKLLIGALTLMALAGCARREPGPVARPVVGKAITIPATDVQFYLLEPGKEKRSGFYAMGAVQTPELPELFGLLADGKVKKPVAGKPILLVGKLPGTVAEEDRFLPAAGAMSGGKIDISAKYLRWDGPDISRLPVWRAVYLTVSLPALPAGRYRATVTPEDHIDSGDGHPKRSKGPVPTFKPLTCNFEVKPVKK